MSAPRPRLLIVGGGFAAFRLLRGVDPARYDVTVVSRRNHFVYTPLLPSTVVGTVEFRSIVEPLRRCRPGARVLVGAALAVDAARRVVRCRERETGHEWEEPYDVLAVAAGAESNTFGVPGAVEHCHFLKEIEEARAIRQHLVSNLEHAALPGRDEDERRRLLHFVAVGAGPTGVRFAAELYDLLTTDLRRQYPDLAPLVRVTVVEAGKTVLSAFDEPLRDYTARQFSRRGIAVRTGCVVAEVGPGWLRLKSGEVLPAGLILWCAGFGPNPFVAGLPWEKDRAGRVVVDDWLRVPGVEGAYALGDCAAPRGRTYPQLAQVAEQQGKYLGRALNGMARGRTPGPFKWHDLGFSSYIGGSDAVKQSAGGRRFSGFLAYQAWRSVMFTELVSLKNRTLVPLSRLMAALFGRDLSKF